MQAGIKNEERIRRAPNEIIVRIAFVDGSEFVQPFPIDYADAVQDFMDWFREPGRIKVWSWHSPAASAFHMFHHRNIIAVDIEGYIEPEGRDSRWYERFIDRLVLWRLRKEVNRGAD